MERVRETEILRGHVEKYPAMKFKDLAKFIVSENPDIESKDLVLRLARLVFNNYYDPDNSNASTSNQSG